MNKEGLMKVLLAPLVSEKTSGLEMIQQYVFKVVPAATKQDIARAVNLMFNVKVVKVRICNYEGKKRTFRKMQGKCKNWKKAYVTLAEGATINLGGV